jgi:hypothetical protein
MDHDDDSEEGDAVVVVLEQPNAAETALKARQTAELTHVLSRSSDEPGNVFALRVLQRVRQIQRKGIRIRELTFAVAEGPNGSKMRGRFMASLVRGLHPGATFTLVGSCLSQVDRLGWMQTLLPIARAGVNLDIVA